MTFTLNSTQIAVLRETGDIRAEVDRLLSEVNAVAVAINKTPLAGDATLDGTLSQKLLSAFGCLYDARKMLDAEMVSA